NNITSLDLSECPELKKLDCSSNAGLTELNINNSSNLSNINVIGFLRNLVCDNTPYSPDEIIKQSRK
ncbi:22939_t:CDS:1, partial [Dentiscutata erythropus]